MSLPNLKPNVGKVQIAFFEESAIWNKWNRFGTTLEQNLGKFIYKSATFKNNNKNGTFGTEYYIILIFI